MLQLPDFPAALALIEKKLHSEDQYEQSDVGVETFEYWYKHAVLYSKNELSRDSMADLTERCLPLLFAEARPGYLSSSVTSEYAAKRLLRHVQKLMEVFSVKPKYIALMLTHGSKILQYLSGKGIKYLEQAAYKASVPVSTRTEAFVTMGSIFRMAKCVYDAYQLHAVHTPSTPTQPIVTSSSSTTAATTTSERPLIDLSDSVNVSRAAAQQSKPTLDPDAALWTSAEIVRMQPFIPLLHPNTFNVDIDVLIDMCVQQSNDEQIRRAALDALLHVFTFSGLFQEPTMATSTGTSNNADSSDSLRIRTKSQLHTQALEKLILKASDVLTLIPCWAAGLARIPYLLSILAARVTKSDSRELAREVCISLHRCIQDDIISFPQDLDGVLTVLRACDDRLMFTSEQTDQQSVAPKHSASVVGDDEDSTVKSINYDVLAHLGTGGAGAGAGGSDSASKSDTHRDDIERDSTVLQCIDAILRNAKRIANSSAVLRFALRDPPLSVESISQVSANINKVTAEGWTGFLAEFLMGKIAAMSPSGVSGAQRDQELITLLREGCRCYYLDQEILPTVEVGRAMLQLVMKAMSRGYIETERFPMILACICANHKNDSCRWFEELILVETAVDNRRTLRAVIEVVMSLLSGSISDETNVGTDSTYRGKLLLTLCNTPSIVAVQIMDELIRNLWPQLPEQQEAAISHLLVTCRSLLMRIQEKMSKAVNPAKFATQLDVIIQLLRTLALRCTSANAAALFDLLVRAMYLHPQGLSSTFSDEALSMTLIKVPSNTKLAPAAVEEAVKGAGVQTRSLLAQIMPFKLLEDSNDEVRTEAFNALHRADPRQLMEHKRLILRAAISRVPKDQVDGPLNLSEATLLTAAAPVLAPLCISEPELTEEVIELVYRGAKLTSKSNPSSYPHKNLLQALNWIVSEGDVQRCTDWLSKSDPISLIHRSNNLLKWAGSWKRVCTQANFIAQKKKAAGGSGSGSGGRSSSDIAYQPVQTDEEEEDESHFTNVMGGGGNGDHSIRYTEEIELTPRLSQPPQEFMSSMWTQLEGLIDRGSYLEATKLAHQIRVSAPQLFMSKDGISLVEKKLLPALAEFEFPRPTSTLGERFAAPAFVKYPELYKGLPSVQFSPAILEDGNFTEKRLFPEESERILSLRFRLSDLVKNKILLVLEQEQNLSKARQLAAEYSQELDNIVHEWIHQKEVALTPVVNASSSSQPYPSAPPVLIESNQIELTDVHMRSLPNVDDDWGRIRQRSAQESPEKMYNYEYKQPAPTAQSKKKPEPQAIMYEL